MIKKWSRLAWLLRSSYNTIDCWNARDVLARQNSFRIEFKTRMNSLWLPLGARERTNSRTNEPLFLLTLSRGFARVSDGKIVPVITLLVVLTLTRKGNVRNPARNDIDRNSRARGSWPLRDTKEQFYGCRGYYLSRQLLYATRH